MDEKKKQLYVFGYGLGLLLPYFVFWHGLDLSFRPATFALFLVGFSAVLVLASRLGTFVSKMNLLALAAPCYVFYLSARQQWGWVPFAACVLAACILLVSVFRVELLRGFYVLWMKTARLVGNIISGLLMAFFFYIIFGSVGIILRLMRKDLLGRQMDRLAPSYWDKPDHIHAEREQYTKQF